ncbi:seizure 6-like protein isoform X2 [Cynoglossus semilaevis]|uniref:Seizure related 6 homolog like n=1 Tax=Cynoglossus semilaevis TaxID=244447 RepID=A0A3P8VZX1_CYNSE|nr:seizure 6-like protein isoform X2 [Cynoglossus semilaevis]XP_024918059.1 seizure 6-like protein isoform X2 [Cynoglossus semilaevis]
MSACNGEGGQIAVRIQWNSQLSGGGCGSHWRTVSRYRVSPGPRSSHCRPDQTRPEPSLSEPAVAMLPATGSVGHPLRVTVAAMLWMLLSINISLSLSSSSSSSVSAPEKEVLNFTLSPRVTTHPPKEGRTGRKSSSAAAGDLLHSLLGQKGRLVSQRGEVFSSALPQNLLPLLDGIGSIPGSRSVERESGGLLRRVSASVSGLGGDPDVSASPADTHSLLPHTQTQATKKEAEVTTTTTRLNVDTEGGAPSSALPRCVVNFSDPEGYIDSLDDPPLPEGASLCCTYTVTVYTGYGVELQVKSVNMSEGEQLSIRGVDEHGALLVLANHTLLVEGQVIRSPTNVLSVLYRSTTEGNVGFFQLHYQIFRLSCSLPKRPHFGEVSVLDLLPGGTARFHCHMGYHLQGTPLLTCLNASMPKWNGKEPICRALCGGTVKNATIGRVLSPSPQHGPNATQESTCSWSLEAPKDQRLHLHLERLALEPTDRLVLWSGLDSGSVVLFDSDHGGQIPFEGVISEGPAVRIQFISEQPSYNTGFNIRYEAFERGHCYEPYIQNGNFTTTDPLYGVGAVVQYTCEPGHSLEQGPPIIECISARDPYWNDTEPICKAQCGGELTGPGGVILSPNWPEWYGEGEDCSWRIHVGEDKRVLLDVQLLNISDSDMLTIKDGDDETTSVLGRYVGGSSPFKLSSTTPCLTITFHSDPAGLVFGKGEGFIINYMEVSRNDSCPDLPEIQNGWKTTSHVTLMRGAHITYQCDPGYDLVGRETLICLLDLSWSSQPPFCEKIMYCSDPGHVEHSTRSLSDPKLLVGTTIQYNCNPGFILQGGATITCYGREPGTPVWTSRLPHCVSEESVSCENPGLPENGYQVLSKRLYLPGESLAFVCYRGYRLIGEVAIKCILGNPSSFWSGPLPLCRAPRVCFGNHDMEVAEATAASTLDGGNLALIVFVLVLLLSVLLGAAYVYVTRCRYHSNLRLPLIYPHPYRQITVETEFDNPLYETGGDTREYEVSI